MDHDRSRHVVQPDPAWDGSEEQDGVLVVELSWPPDALAGRMEELVVSPELAAALTAYGLTGFRTGAARGVLGENSFGVEPGAPPPALLRLIPGADPAADFAYAPKTGLTVSRRALEVLREHCENLTVEIQVRQFEWSDYDAVAAVWAAADREVLPRAELEAKLTRDPELFLVADAGGEVAGVVMGTYDGRRGWIVRLAVPPSHRRRGIATLLVEELEIRFRVLECPRINLLVMPDNAAGLHFWRSLGYLPYPDVLCSKPLT